MIRGSMQVKECALTSSWRTEKSMTVQTRHLNHYLYLEHLISFLYSSFFYNFNIFFKKISNLFPQVWCSLHQQPPSHFSRNHFSQVPQNQKDHITPSHINQPLTDEGTSDDQNKYNNRPFLGRHVAATTRYCF